MDLQIGKWLFILEAVPAILLGIIIFFLLNDRVQDAAWLTESEKTFIASQIELESVKKTHTSLGSIFLSARVWLMIVLCFGIIMGTSAVGFWLPTIIRETNVSNTFYIGLLSMIPYLAAFISMILTGRNADRMRERRWHVICPLSIAAFGFLLCTQSNGNTFLAVTGLTMATAGVLTGLPMFWSLPTAFLGGTAAAAGIPYINCIGSLSGFFSPAIIGFLKTSTGSLNSGLYLVVGCLAATALLIRFLVPAKLVNH